MKLEWDENKRRSNLVKHGLDFTDAAEILESRYRMDREIVRDSEVRIQSFSYVMERLAVLTLVHMERNESVRIVSFRYASEDESEVYYDWLQQENQ